MLVIMRKQEKAFGKHAFNAIGFLGGGLSRDETDYNELITYKPKDILDQICIKNNQKNFHCL